MTAGSLPVMICRLPALTFTLPAKVFVPVRVNLPAPCFTNPPELVLARLPAKVTFCPLVSIAIGACAFHDLAGVILGIAGGVLQFTPAKRDIAAARQGGRIGKAQRAAVDRRQARVAIRAGECKLSGSIYRNG